MTLLIILIWLSQIVYLLPIRDRRSRRLGFPWMTLSLVIINTLIHILVVVVSSGSDEVAWVMLYPYMEVPRLILDGEGLGALSVLTSGFLHGGWWHLAGNMFILWFFGRKVEDLIGPFQFFLFYLLCLLGAGITSTIGRYALSPVEASVPSIGASGAVSGVMAAYLFLFTGERITTLVLPIPYLFSVPAWIYIVYNFGHDLLLGLLTEEVVKQYGSSPFGTDVFAHMGGLVVGLAFIYLYLPPEALIHQRRVR